MVRRGQDRRTGLVPGDEICWFFVDWSLVVRMGVATKREIFCKNAQGGVETAYCIKDAIGLL